MKPVTVLLCGLILAFPLHSQNPPWENLWQSAQMAMRGGRHVEAENLLEQARRQAESTRSLDTRLGSAFHLLCRRYFGLDRHAESERACRSAISVWEKVAGPDGGQIVPVLHMLAATQEALGRYAEANRQREQAAGILEKAFGPDHPAVAKFLMDSAANRSIQGRHTEAEAWHRRAMEILERIPVDRNPLLEDAMRKYAGILRKLARDSEAVEWEARADDYRRRSGLFETRSGVTAPARLENPAFPRFIDFRQRLDARVTITLVIDEAGVPSTVWLLNPVRPDLDAEAIDTVKQWRFRPARRSDGTPVAVTMTAEFGF